LARTKRGGAEGERKKPYGPTATAEVKLRAMKERPPYWPSEALHRMMYRAKRFPSCRGKWLPGPGGRAIIKGKFKREERQARKYP